MGRGTLAAPRRGHVKGGVARSSPLGPEAYPASRAWFIFPRPPPAPHPIPTTSTTTNLALNPFVQMCKLSFLGMLYFYLTLVLSMLIRRMQSESNILFIHQWPTVFRIALLAILFWKSHICGFKWQRWMRVEENITCNSHSEGIGHGEHLKKAWIMFAFLNKH